MGPMRGMASATPRSILSRERMGEQRRTLRMEHAGQSTASN